MSLTMIALTAQAMKMSKGADSSPSRPAQRSDVMPDINERNPSSYFDNADERAKASPGTWIQMSNAVKCIVRPGKGRSLRWYLNNRCSSRAKCFRYFLDKEWRG